MHFTFDKTRLFPNIVGLSALFVAGIAAFFSVMGISLLFSGATISAALMATSLEVGKVVATTFLYRYWTKTKTFIKVYLIVAVVMLMAITSLGIFGWLSSAYQSSALNYEIAQQQLVVMSEQKSQLQTQVTISKQRLDDLMENRRSQEKRLNDSLNNEALLRNPTQLRQVQEQNNQLIRQTEVETNNEKTRYTGYLTDVLEFDKKIAEAKMDTTKTKDVITFKFVAEALGLDLTKTVKWFILAIILVFDPLAIALILAYNITLEKKEVVVEKPVVVEVPIPVVPVMDNIVKDEPEIKKEEPVLSVVSPVVEPPKNIHPTPNHTLRDSEIFHSPTR